MNNLLTSQAQNGIPGYVWIIVAIIAVIVLLVVAIKSFWISKSVATLLSIVGIVYSSMILKSPNNALTNAIIGSSSFLEDIDPYMLGSIICALILSICYIFLLGNAIFDSETEGDYLIAGTLVHDTNHPLKAFFEYVGGILVLAGLIFLAAYYWTFIIGLCGFILTLALSVGMIYERVKG